MLPCMQEPIVNNELDRIYKEAVITQPEGICLDRMNRKLTIRVLMY
jgi:hypothetical protein